MANQNYIIPTTETFKEEALALQKADPSIENRSKALDLLARTKYGHKNYATIKPNLKKSVFPLSEFDLQNYMDTYALEIGKRQGGHINFFLTRAFSIYSPILKIYFKNKKYHPFIKNKKDLNELQMQISAENILIVLKKELESNKESAAGKDLLNQLVFLYKGVPDILKNDINKESVWTTPFEEVLARHKEFFDQLSFAYQATVFFFLSLSRESMDKEYYSNLKEGVARTNKEEREEVSHFTKDLEILLKTAYIHETEKSFIDDVLKNRPIDRRVHSFDLMNEHYLSIIFKHKYSFEEAMVKLNSNKNMEEMILFLNHLDDLNFKDIQKEFKKEGMLWT